MTQSNILQSKSVPDNHGLFVDGCINTGSVKVKVTGAVKQSLLETPVGQAVLGVVELVGEEVGGPGYQGKTTWLTTRGL